VKSLFTIIRCSALPLLAAGCLTSVGNGPADAGPAPAPADAATAAGDPTTNPNDADALTYRDLATHPGCSTNGLKYTAAQIPGYMCAAKEYPMGSVPEDTTKPIVLLIHGNSSTPGDWEPYPAGGTPMLSDRLVAQGFHVFAVDMRIDLTDDPTSNDPKTGNPAHNIDHEWGVPIVEHFIDSMMKAYPTRHFSMVAFSYGPTTTRDALRRLLRAGKNPFARIDDLVFGSGGNHGVSTFRKMCGDPSAPANVTMAGRIACEMGDLVAFTPTTFDTPLNGPSGAYETPCSDGNTAYGQSGVCGGHTVRYTTIVMRDVSQGTYQDEFVSEGSAALLGANNLKNELTDQDQTGYFYNGLFKNHFGSIRSEAGLTKIINALSHAN
jgi:pimeloyl-ACP methyl ester carboxylesterase